MHSSEVEELKKKLKQEFSDYYEISGGKNYRYYHLETVHNIVRKLIEELEVDVNRKVAEIAALYHDIGRAEDIEDGEMDPFKGHEGHAERGAEKVSEFVSEYVSDEELQKIEDIIAKHHSDAETTEGKIVQDADELSNFGVNNLWRKIHYSSYHGRTLKQGFEYFWNEQLDEYKDKLENFYFDYTREKAEERLEKQKEAFKQMEKEIKAGDI